MAKTLAKTASSSAMLPVIMFFKILMLTLAFTMFLLNAWFLYYVEELKKSGCACALGWKRTFVQASLFVFLVTFVVGFFVDWRSYKAIAFLMFLLTVAYLIIAREFIMQVKDAHCKCAQNDAFEVLSWVNFIQIVLFVVYLVLVFLKLALHK